MVEGRGTQRGTLQTEDVNFRPRERRFSASALLITATTVAGAETVLEETTDEEVLQFSGLVVSNLTGSPATVSFASAVGAAVPVAQDILVESLSVPANDLRDLSDLLMINPGQRLVAFSDTASALRVAAWVTAYR